MSAKSSTDEDDPLISAGKRTAVIEMEKSVTKFDYCLTKKLVSGSEGVVYEASAPSLEHIKLSRMAVKVIPYTIKYGNGLRFLDVIRPDLDSAKFSSRSLLRPVTIDFNRDGVFIFMERMDYNLHDLAVLLKHSGLDHLSFIAHNVAIPLATVLIDALLSLLEESYSHGDIKPSNILIKLAREDGSVKLADFGQAGRIKIGCRSELGARRGSPRYMAPEVSKSRYFCDRSDSWSIAATLFEVLTGQEFTTNDVAFQPDVPAELQQFLRCCLKVRPSERPSVDELESWRSTFAKKLRVKNMSSVHSMLSKVILDRLESTVWVQKSEQLLPFGSVASQFMVPEILLQRAEPVFSEGYDDDDDGDRDVHQARASGDDDDDDDNNNNNYGNQTSMESVSKANMEPRSSSESSASHGREDMVPRTPVAVTKSKSKRSQSIVTDTLGHPKSPSVRRPKHKANDLPEDILTHDFYKKLRETVYASFSTHSHLSPLSTIAEKAIALRAQLKAHLELLIQSPEAPSDAAYLKELMIQYPDGVNIHLFVQILLREASVERSVRSWLEGNSHFFKGKNCPSLLQSHNRIKLENQIKKLL